MPGEERTYRRWIESDLRTFEVCVGESDLLMSAERPRPELAERALRRVRERLEAYLTEDPEFARTMTPRSVRSGAPEIVAQMAEAATACGVGPMAAVAGAVAQAVGEAVLPEAGQVIVENGGDIFLWTTRPRVAAIYAGSSPLSGKLGVKVSRLSQPLGLCTSSGTVGHSLSFGKADAAIVLAESAPLADAAATALGNRVREAADIQPGLDWLRELQGALGGAVVVGESLGAWGEAEFVGVGE
jgi:ApbE superfamily uncharacterized protein (UPF0280 family)